ncbi:hypothetical protein IC575_010402 [Cucumis melo]
MNHVYQQNSHFFFLFLISPSQKKKKKIISSYFLAIEFKYFGLLLYIYIFFLFLNKYTFDSCIRSCCFSRNDREIIIQVGG